MECPNCRNEIKVNEDLTRGMGNQSFQDCPVCGLVALCSGERVTQAWRPSDDVKKGVNEYAIRTVR